MAELIDSYQKVHRHYIATDGSFRVDALDVGDEFNGSPEPSPLRLQQRTLERLSKI